MQTKDIKYVSNEEGTIVEVIVPIEIWHEIQSEKETAYLLESPTMKKRLLEAKNHQEGMSIGKVCEKLNLVHNSHNP